ncbi:MAG: MFS transporter [Acidaminobacteraceae bacterium]
MKKFRLRLFISTILMLAFILFITGFINLNTFESNMVDTEIRKIYINSSDFVNKIEYSLKYGKSLDKFYGMESNLKNWKEQYDYIDNAVIILNDGRINYSYIETEEVMMSDEVKTIVTSIEKDFYEYSSNGDKSIIIPIKNRKLDVEGYLKLDIKNTYFEELMKKYSDQLTMILLILFSVGSLVALLFSFSKRVFTKDGGIGNKYIIIVVILLASLIQIIYSAMSYNLFNDAYMELSQDIGTTVATSIQSDIEKVINAGVNYDDIANLDSYFNDIMKVVPQIKNIEIIELSKKEKMNVQFNQDELLIKMELPSDSSDKTDILGLQLDFEYIRNGLKEILLDNVTIFATSFFLMVEVVLFLMLYLKNSLDGFVKESFEDKKYNGSNLRILAFVMYTACYMPVSFIPLVMRELLIGNNTVDSNFLLGLPISVVFFSGALFTIIGGKWIDKYGWKKILYIGVIGLIFSTMLSALTTSPYIFIATRAVYGVAYALLYISMRGFAALFSDDNAKKIGFSSITSGIYAGVNTGAVFGAILMSKIGYEKVFMLSSFVMLIGLVLIKLYFNFETSEVAVQKEKKKSNVKDFIFSKDILNFLLLVTVPMALTVIFLDYYYPVYGQYAGIASGDIGRAYLLNGIFVAYVSPLLLRYLNKYVSTKTTVLISLFLVFSSFMVFSVGLGVIGMLISAVILGTGEGIGLSAQTEYYLKLDSTKHIGRGEALGYYSNVRKLTQTVGPQIFAFATIWGYEKGMMYIGLTILAMMILFVAFEKIRTIQRA